MALHALQPDYISSIRDSAGVLDAVVCTNRLACELVARNTPISSDRIYYAPYGVEMNATAAARQINLNRTLRIAYVGRLERTQKRIEDIVDVVAELDRRGSAYELVIAGDGPDEQWLQAQLSNTSGSGRIRFLGTLTGLDLVDQVYSHAHALLITSHWETGPIVAWEAMANAVTVVTSAYIGSGLENSLEPGHNCLIFPVGDMVAAVDCLEKLRDRSLRNRILQRGLALVAGRYSMTASIEHWSKSLEAIAEKCPLQGSCGLAERTQSPPAGRLDRLLGQQVGETVRGLLGLKYNHREPGGEWPHVNLCSEIDDEAFWQLAMSLDRRPPSQGVGRSTAIP
jgi:glycosyltransferase involved in cell wall biosynthesis